MYLWLEKNYPHTYSENNQQYAKHKFLNNYLQFLISSYILISVTDAS